MVLAGNGEWGQQVQFGDYHSSTGEIWWRLGLPDEVGEK